MKRCIGRGFGIFVFSVWKIQMLKSVKILLKYSKRFASIKKRLTFVSSLIQTQYNNATYQIRKQIII